MKLKKGLGLLLAAVLACGAALPAGAEQYTGADNWNVSFTGKGMESNFKSSVFDDAMTALQPGDSVSLTVHLQNATTDAITDWYMTNEVLRSLEESQQVARNGGYSYELTYTGPNGEKAVLYSSDAIGGDKNQQAGLGLHEATDSLEDFFYLDQLLAGQSATVTLDVSLDGETQGNAYQDTLAQLQMNFATELKDIPDGGRFDSNYTDTVSSHGRRLGKNTRGKRTVYVTRIPQTSDDSNPLLIAVVCGVSGLALLVLGILRLRKSKKDNAKEGPHA
ncbi:LPXTG cell wall anchor domain-containing protein [Gemmiger sp.]